MSAPKFYTIKKNPTFYFDLEGVCGTPKERGLDGDCENGGKHAWFVFPSWAGAVQEGGKVYLMCLKCEERSHL